MRILLQFPEGLKDKALKYARDLEGQGNEVFVSASPTFGACDLALDEAKNIKADRLVHFGHSEFNKVEFNVEYVEYKMDASLSMLEDSLRFLSRFKVLGIVTNVQHIHQLQDIKKFYERNGKRVITGKPYGFARHEGQLLGCDVGSSASIDGQIDAHIYFGGGLFHPLGALLATAKPFLVIDPFAGRIEFIDGLRERYRKRSRGKILASLDMKKVGILFSTKNGQQNMQLAKELKHRIESEGLEAQILVANTFDFDSLNNMMEFDAFVNTACPRLATDDTERVMKPLLSANELMEVLKMKRELKLAEIKNNKK